jgi:hypothetical protein
MYVYYVYERHMAAGVLVSYLTLRPRPAAASAPSTTSATSERRVETTAAREAEAIGESLGELVVPAEFTLQAPSSRPNV